jgi:hypothetical protein
MGKSLKLFTGTAGVLPATSAVRRDDLLDNPISRRLARGSRSFAGGTPAVPVESSHFIPPPLLHAKTRPDP